MKLNKLQDRIEKDECKYYLILFNDEFGDKRIWSMEHSLKKANEEFDYVVDTYDYQRVWIEEMNKTEVKEYKVVRVIAEI